MKIRSSGGQIYQITLPGSAPAGGEYYIVCPVCSLTRKPEHRNERKLAVNMHKKPMLWRCNHCNESGMVFTDEDIIRKKIKPMLSYPKWKAPEPKHYQWFKNRGISQGTVDYFKVTMSRENIMQEKHSDPEKKGKWLNTECINFPFYHNGILINIKYRDPRKNFKLVAAASKVFFNIDTIKKYKYAIIVEGEPDCMSYHEVGLPSVVSVPNGATISREEKLYYEETGTVKVLNPLNLEYLDLCIDEFDHIETIYIATDDDAPGIKLRNELARRLGKERCKYIKFSDYKTAKDESIKDANQLLLEKGAQVLLDSIDHAYSFPIEDVSTAEDYLEEMLNDYDHGRERGKSTGFHSLDPYFTLYPGWLYLLNGYPNEGKTTFWLNIMAIASVLYGDKWGIYSPENYPIKNIIDTLCEILLNNTSNPEIKSRIKKYELKTIVQEHIQKHFFFVNNEDGYTPVDLIKIKTELIRRKGINGFFTDPWSALKHPGMRDIREDQYIAQCLNEEIRLAYKFNIMNVISHHPPKPSEAKGPLKAPHPYQLSGGAMWWNKSYVICCVHRLNRTDFTDTKVGFHVQKVKEVKIFGDRTNTEEPVIFRYDHRSNRYFERIDIKDTNSEYKRYPFKKWESKEQLTFESFT